MTVKTAIPIRVPDRYVVQLTAPLVDDPMVHVACHKCGYTLFQWRSTSAFGLEALAESIAKHEDTWHSDSSGQ